MGFFSLSNTDLMNEIKIILRNDEIFAKLHENS